MGNIYAIPVKADEKEIQYENYIAKETVLYPNQETVETVRVEHEKRIALEKKQRQNLAANPKGNYCSCVTYAKSKTTFKTPIGIARRWPVNAKIGSVGGVIITNESWAGHVAVIVAINDLGYVLDEANYSRCRKTYGRVMPFNDTRIIGFWN